MDGTRVLRSMDRSPTSTASACLVPSVTRDAVAAPQVSSTGGANGFDFLLGHWQVGHRRLADRLVGCSDWIEFPGTLDVFSILDGAGDIDDNDLFDPQGRYRATSLRLYDEVAGQWSIRWIDGRRPGLDDPPLIGRFDGREGRFYGTDTHRGMPILIRFIYLDVAHGSASWAQAFSADHGATWETNWTMDFKRG